MSASLVLTINSGSSSIKTSVYRMAGGEELLAAGQLDGIGREQGRFRMKDGKEQPLNDQTLNLPDHAAALSLLFDWFRGQSFGDIAAVGHRVVHGGPHFQTPSRVTGDLLGEVRKLIPFDPLHLPSE